MSEKQDNLQREASSGAAVSDRSGDGNLFEAEEVDGGSPDTQEIPETSFESNDTLVFPPRKNVGPADLSLGNEAPWNTNHTGTKFRPDRAPAQKRRRYVVITSLVVVLVVVVVGFLFMSYQSASSGKPRGKSVAIDVTPGSSYGQLEQRFLSKGVISSITYFSIFLKLSGNVILQPGYYVFRRNEPYSAILAGIVAGPKTYKLTIPDGFSLSAIAQVIGKLPGHSTSSFLSLAENTPPKSTGFSEPGITSSLGFLYPDTYFLDPTWSNQRIMQVMLDRFSEVAKQLNLNPQGTYHGLTGYQVVVAASIIEREAKAVSDYPKVARVILNRLRANMPLQMDSTVRFATANYSGPLTVGQLQDNSPYNTYVHPGLPPSPISSPDKAAIAAVLHPAAGSWLYFVTLKGRSVSSFFDTYQQQQSAINASGGL
ncbi:MAG: endolytic transglycosylase MltG [Acidimicrobiaceae bacterium]|nr:endolytic transglycosylase MltG [Acidimicrobiaceae bacterium]